MSLSALYSVASKVLPTVNFQPHGHRKGARVDAAGTSSASATSSISSGPNGMAIGQLPVGAATPLFSNILQSLQQTVGAQAAAAAATPAATAAGAAGATATAVTNGTAANVQAFMHSLFQALRQDGLGGGTGTGAASPATASIAGAAAAGSGSTPANLVSSLQTLIGQVGSGGAGSAATANLSAAYQHLVSSAPPGSVAVSAASAGASSSQPSSAGLQHFLGTLLQNLQSGGVSSFGGIGNNVNANV